MKPKRGRKEKAMAVEAAQEALKCAWCQEEGTGGKWLKTHNLGRCWRDMKKAERAAKKDKN